MCGNGEGAKFKGGGDLITDKARPSKFLFFARFSKIPKKKRVIFFGKISPFKKHSSTKLDVVEIGRTLHPERLREEVIHKRTQNLCLGSIHLFFKKMD